MVTVPAPRQGIVLEVETSTVAGSGRGLFLRPTARRRGDVWQAGGSAFYGYDGKRFKDRLGDDNAAHRRDRAFASWRWRGWAQSSLDCRRCNCRLSGVALVVCRLVAVCPVAARGGVPSAVGLYEEAYP